MCEYSHNKSYSTASVEKCSEEEKICPHTSTAKHYQNSKCLWGCFSNTKTQSQNVPGTMI